MCSGSGLAKCIVVLSLIITALCSVIFFALGGYFMYSSGIVYDNNLLINGCFILGAVLLILLVLGWAALSTKTCFVHILYLVGLIAVFVMESYLCYLAFTKSGDFNGSQIWNSMDKDSKVKFQDWAECCGYDSLAQGEGTCTYTVTCKQKVDDTISSKYGLLKWILLGLAVFQVINLICAAFIAGSDAADSETAKIKRNIALLENARQIRH